MATRQSATPVKGALPPKQPKEADGAAAAVVTRERLSCLGDLWRGGDEAEMRGAVGAVLRACLLATPHQRRPRREKLQDSWRPGTAQDCDADGGEAQAEAAQEAEAAEKAAADAAAAVAAQGPDVGLRQFNDAEHAAVEGVGGDEAAGGHQRLAAG